MEWIEVPREEQETIVNINYGDKIISIFTNRKATAKRLLNKIGEPTTIEKHQELICSVTYVRNLFDKDVSKFFSKGLLIGCFRIKKDKEV